MSATVLDPRIPAVSPSNSDVLSVDETTGHLQLSVGGAAPADVGGGGGGTVDSIVGGDWINVDSTDPAHPIVSAARAGVVESIVAGTGINVDETDPANPVVSATGDSTVHTDDTMSGDGSSGDPLSVVPQFGSDTLVKLPNSGATLVDALELIASLTNNSPGSEVSKYLVKLLSAGAQVDALSIQTTGLGVGDYLYFLNDASLDTFIVRNSENSISLYCGGSFICGFNASGITINADIGAQLSWGPAGVAYNSPTGRIVVHAAGANVGNIQLGEDAAVGLTDTAGFATIPNCAGTPTGVPANVPAGQTAMIADTAANKLWLYIGGGWKYAALT